LNPLSLWDLYWVKELDDNGFSDQVVDSLQRASVDPLAEHLPK